MARKNPSTALTLGIAGAAVVGLYLVMKKPPVVADFVQAAPAVQAPQGPSAYQIWQSEVASQQTAQATYDQQQRDAAVAAELAKIAAAQAAAAAPPPANVTAAASASSMMAAANAMSGVGHRFVPTRGRSVAHQTLRFR